MVDLSSPLLNLALLGEVGRIGPELLAFRVEVFRELVQHANLVMHGGGNPVGGNVSTAVTSPIRKQLTSGLFAFHIFPIENR